MNQTCSQPGQLVSIARSDRWFVHHRLKELNIACICLEDGSLRVEIDTPTAAVQLRSVVQQLIASRQQLIDWVEQCWSLPSPL